MLDIRPFSNADLPHLADIWCIHHATYRSPPNVTHSVFEQAVASRLFFDPSRLLVATIDERPVAWCHWFPGPDGNASVQSLCFLPGPAIEVTTHLLLQRVESDALASGSSLLTIGVHCHQNHGYQGLDPVGHGLGIDVADDRTNTLLESIGYHETQRLDRWKVLTSSYRAPVNRDFLMLRRMTRLQRTNAPVVAMEIAAGMIHFDVERHSLIDLRTKQEICFVDVWTSDPEALVMPMGEAILGRWVHPSHSPSESSGDPAEETALRYLVASIVPTLYERRIMSLQRSVVTDNHAEAATLSATHFSRTSAGRLMAKRLR